MSRLCRIESPKGVTVLTVGEHVEGALDLTVVNNSSREGAAILLSRAACVELRDALATWLNCGDYS